MNLSSALNNARLMDLVCVLYACLISAANIYLDVTCVFSIQHMGFHNNIFTGDYAVPIKCHFPGNKPISFYFIYLFFGN